MRKYLSIFLFLLILVSTLVACDSEHTCDYKLTSTKNPTCEFDGYQVYACDCGNSYKETLNSYGGHEFGEYIYDGNATCTNDGTMSAVCCRCETKSTVTATDTKLSHTFTSYTYNGNATCKSDGTKTAYCDTCSIATDTVTATGTRLACEIERWYTSDNLTSYGKCDDCNTVSYGTVTESEHDLALYSGSRNGSSEVDWFVCSNCGIFFDVDDVLKLTITDGKHTDGFCLTVSAKYSSLTFSSVGLMQLPLDLEIESDNFGEHTALADYASSITELVFEENVRAIEELSQFEYVERVTASEDLEYIGDECFFMCAFLSEVYLLGDCPTLGANSLYRSLRSIDDSIPSPYNPILYYMPGALGYSGYKMQGFTLREYGASSPTAPEVTILEYSAATVDKSLEIAEDFFLGFEDSGNLFHLIPHFSFERYRDIYTLAHSLTDTLTTESEKAEAIFNWIISNITYSDVARYYTVEEVFDKKLAVCNGYAILMHDMLSAVGISSLYTHGIVTYADGLLISEILDGSHTTKHVNDHHAWLICYLDGESVICDPTWGQFDIDPDEFSTTRLTLGVYGVDTIPDNFDPRLYSNIHYYDGDKLYYLEYGNLSTSSSTETTFNFSLSVSYQFYLPNDGYVFTGESPELYSAYRELIAEYSDMGYLFTNYYDSAFRTYNYLTVLKYILFYDLYCDTDMTVEFIEEYTFDEYGNIYLVLSDTELEFIGTVFDGAKLVVPATVGEREVVGIGWHAFNGCYAEEIILPDTVEYISSAAFWGCHNLTELTLPKNLKSLGISVFSFCEKLERLVLPQSLEFIGLPDNKHSCLPYQMFSELDPDTLTVVYEGTKEQFDTINFYNPWGDGSGDHFDYEHYEHILEFIEFNQ